MRLHRDSYHREFGQHSGIPECCIEHFISGNYLEGFTEHLGYRRCDSCRASGRIAEIHTCSEECAPFLRSIGMSEDAIEGHVSRLVSK